jgi:hypothetical protein
MFVRWSALNWMSIQVPLMGDVTRVHKIPQGMKAQLIPVWWTETFDVNFARGGVSRPLKVAIKSEVGVGRTRGILIRFKCSLIKCNYWGWAEIGRKVIKNCIGLQYRSKS